MYKPHLGLALFLQILPLQTKTNGEAFKALWVRRLFIYLEQFCFI